MEGSDVIWLLAEREARKYLQQLRSPWMRSYCDDLTQEATIAAWQWAKRVRHPERFWAAVRTIARRLCGRARRAPRLLPLPISRTVTHDPARWPERYYVIAGRRVSMSLARPWLQHALGRLRPVDRDLLLGFYEGSRCSELAERFRRSRLSVKMRIHRARLRVQRSVESCARTAVDVDD